ncbi:hypothetical protein C4566_03270 [Candidatus Parcubacteria bacterium]|nr:MAG: hypothetical protein C4566_03270 [Candidatus Parcubacteria bacterium]
MYNINEVKIKIKIKLKNKNMSFYGKIYPAAWQTIKKNYYLLFFGLFASVLGFFSETNTFLNLNNTEPDFISANLIHWSRIMDAIINSGSTLGSFSGLLGIVSIFIIMAIVVVITVSSQGALIHSAYHNNLKGKKNNTSKGLFFKENFQVGLEKFWPLLGLGLIHSFITFFFIIFVIDPLIYFVTMLDLGPLFILLLSIIIFFVLVPMVVVISFVTRYGAAYIVLKNQKLIDAFLNAWLLFKINWLVTIENALVMIFITIVYSLILSGVMALAFVPVIIVSLLLSTTNPVLFFIISTVGSFLGVLLLFLGIALYGAFYNIVWTNVFLHLVAPGKSQSKIHRLAQKHLPHLAK